MKAREHYTDDKGLLRLKCNKCGQFKLSEDFNKSSNGFMGLHSKCRECHKKESRQHYVKNIDRYKKNARKWKKNHPGRIKKYAKKRRAENPIKIMEITNKCKEKRNKKYGFNVSSLHYKANHFISKYKLRPTKCPICDKVGRIEFHHSSYESPELWSVGVFCCKHCHERIHSGKIKAPEPIDLLNQI